jgi:uncharacterized Rmd1/YagE family protein
MTTLRPIKAIKRKPSNHLQQNLSTLKNNHGIQRKKQREMESFILSQFRAVLNQNSKQLDEVNSKQLLDEGEGTMNNINTNFIRGPGTVTRKNTEKCGDDDRTVVFLCCFGVIVPDNLVRQRPLERFVTYTVVSPMTFSLLQLTDKTKNIHHAHLILWCNNDIKNWG